VVQAVYLILETQVVDLVDLVADLMVDLVDLMVDLMVDLVDLMVAQKVQVVQVVQVVDRDPNLLACLMGKNQTKTSVKG
jgi:hypothetical protein